MVIIMEYGIAGTVYIALQTALLAGVRYWLYQDNLRVNVKIMYPVLAAVSLCASLIWLAAGSATGVVFEYFRIILAAFMFVLSCFIIKEPFTKHALSYAFIMAYDAMFEATANFLSGVLTAQKSVTVYILSAVVVLAVTFIPCVRLLKKMIVRLSALENDRIFGQLCVICFSFVLMNLLFTFPASGKVTLLMLLSRYLMFFGMVGVYAAATRVMQTMQAAAEDKARLALTERRVALQEEYYNKLASQMEEVRRMRHDLRHHRTALGALVKKGDLTALTEYLEDTAAVEDNTPVTGNLTADSVLLYFTDAAKALGIRVETDLVICGKTPLSDTDLCVILGNLLENAVEAQQYVQPEKRFIRVRAAADGESFTLAVDNSFNNEQLHTGTVQIQQLSSRKQTAGHGIGISSVQAVCEKYGGVLQLEVQDDVFMAGVVI